MVQQLIQTPNKILPTTDNQLTVVRNHRYYIGVHRPQFGQVVICRVSCYGYIIGSPLSLYLDAY